jgi:hypothetical protein
MAILAQCLTCRAKREVSSKLCNCGVDSDKAKTPTLMGSNANAVLKEVSLPFFLFFDQLRF